MRRRIKFSLYTLSFEKRKKMKKAAMDCDQAGRDRHMRPVCLYT